MSGEQQRAANEDGRRDAGSSTADPGSDDQALEQAMAVHSVDDATRVRAGGDDTRQAGSTGTHRAAPDEAAVADGERGRPAGGGSSAEEQLNGDRRRARADRPGAPQPEDDLPHAAPPTGDANR